MPRRRSLRPFTPYQPPPPPAGSYDPALDAQRGQVGRGLFDLSQDIGTQNVRDTTDYGLQREQLQRQQGYGQQDLTTGRDRSLNALMTQLHEGTADIGTRRGQLTEDHARSLEMLARGYQQLGGRQRQQANAAGVLNGGALLQAAAKRKANEAIDRRPIDTGFQRATGELDTAQARLQSGTDSRAREVWDDFNTGSQRLGEGTDYGLGQLALSLAPPDANNPLGGRSFQDRTNTLTRAQRDAAAFGLDLEGQRAYQAAGSGWAPPGRGERGGIPSNEFVDAYGQHRRVVVQGNQRLTVDPSGRVIDRRRR